ncbi:MAG: cold shock domain-containing protein [Bryobacteraceae bacterium]
MQVTFRNMESDLGLEKMIRAQAAKLERYYRAITSCRVSVEMLGRHTHGDIYHVRIGVELPRGELAVETKPGLRSGMRDMATEEITKRDETGRHRRMPRRAILEAFGEMRRRLQDYGRKQRGDVKRRAAPLTLGRVSALRAGEDHGFLETRDGRQVYFDRGSVVDNRFDTLRTGSRVRFCEEKGAKGPRATTVRLVHPRKQAKTAAAVVPTK